MSLRVRALVLLVVTLLLAGCVLPAATPEPAAPAPPSEIRLGQTLLHHGGTQGGLGLLHLSEGERASVTFPPGVLVVGEDGRLAAETRPIEISTGSLVQYLPPYGASNLRVKIEADGVAEERDLALSPGRSLVDGTRVVDLLKVQRDQFAHRTPGQPNYTKAVSYFEGFFANLSYEVETFRTPVPLALPPPLGLHTDSVTSVIATKRGLVEPDRYIVLGGHFDVVPETTHGALDNTGGTMAVLALAEAFSRFNTSQSIVFAAWGGEEDGILGSQAWLTAHADLVPKIDLYVNYDVSGLSWPAPLVAPAAIIASTGPDGPIGDALARSHEEVVSTWMQLDLPYEYQPVVRGQATGAGVNAQSDHTPFLARGIPVLFQFTSDIDTALGLIHSERDTVENLTRYALHGPQGLDATLEPQEILTGEAVLARSYETQMVAGFYLIALTDAGLFPGARPVNAAPLLR